jgi:hypothetical protein
LPFGHIGRTLCGPRQILSLSGVVFSCFGETVGRLDSFNGVDVLYDSSNDKGSSSRGEDDSERCRY